MKMNKKVYAIIVGYNPVGDELEKSVENLQKQVDMVVVCNNSVADFRSDSDKVKVFNFGDNLGIGKAQNVGMEWAFNNGADFIIQLDQDSILLDNSISKLVASYYNLTDRGYKVGLVAVRDYDKKTKKVDKARIDKGQEIEGNYTIVKHIISSGSLIPKCAYLAVGGMEEGLFISGVDFEYCWRLRANGFSVIRDNNVMMEHQIGNGRKKIIGNLELIIPAPVRDYYYIRSVLQLIKRGYVPVYWKFYVIVKFVFSVLVYPFVADNYWQRLKFMAKGIKDGVLGKYGRIDRASR
ncbi:MAG: glycosyltransferase family 2 protein [Flavobacteriaceae bacterium]|nr:glycosyltransferase family 2 protein [Flavobacteriaceae bacterium]